MNSAKQCMNSDKQWMNSKPMWGYCSRAEKKKKDAENVDIHAQKKKKRCRKRGREKRGMQTVTMY